MPSIAESSSASSTGTAGRPLGRGRCECRASTRISSQLSDFADFRFGSGWREFLRLVDLEPRLSCGSKDWDCLSNQFAAGKQLHIEHGFAPRPARLRVSPNMPKSHNVRVPTCLAMLVRLQRLNVPYQSSGLTRAGVASDGRCFIVYLRFEDNF